jgi:hypothetical protein
MPDKRTHRGPHPADEKLFAADAISNLRTAIADFSLLLTRGYAEKGLCAAPAPTSNLPLEGSVVSQ